MKREFEDENTTLIGFVESKVKMLGRITFLTTTSEEAYICLSCSN